MDTARQMPHCNDLLKPIGNCVAYRIYFRPTNPETHVPVVTRLLAYGIELHGIPPNTWMYKIYSMDSFEKDHMSGWYTPPTDGILEVGNKSHRLTWIDDVGISEDPRFY